MRKAIIMAAFIFAAALFTMCKENGTIPVESNWEVQYLNVNGEQIEVPEDHKATIAFLKDYKIAGETGCNRFFGNYNAEGNTLKLDNIGCTRMMCPHMQFESAYLNILNEAAEFSIGEDSMTIRDKSGNLVAVLKKIEPVALEN